MIAEKEIVGMCERLAYKYNSESHREDLVQEGVLKCYEILAKEPDAHPAKLHREANRRMHSYLNLETQPVFIPDHSRARRLARDIEDEDTGNMSDDGHAWLKLVLASENIPYSEDFGISSDDHATDYEEREYGAYLMAVAVTTLSPEEWKILKMRYWLDMTQDEVGVAVNENQKWVSRHEKSALSKLQATLCNNS
jgi:RNA polymerase sigma factor (sigma-70 family)